MKILYSIQGTGNGHLARATQIVPILQQLGDVDILVSGIQGDLTLPFPVKYKLYGLSFIFGKKGGVDLFKTIWKFKPVRLLRDIFTLPVNDYDLVITDFEPVSAWACKLKSKKSIGLSHQNAVLHKNAPKAQKRNLLGKLILKYYAPADSKYGFHFKQLDDFNFTPVIRSQIRNSTPENKGHYTVYLPAFCDSEIEQLLSGFNELHWEVFSKHCPSAYQKGNIRFQPVSFDAFNKSFINCQGILCTAGFETPAEAIFMGKKLCVIPMYNQYEQICNATFLKQLGITVIDNPAKMKTVVGQWIENECVLQIDYPDNIAGLLQNIVQSNQ